ncbi:MAG: tRNA (guanosine(37)-N1)-methyltransferase TrmD [Magnetococcus sp. DMHC-6]
MKFSILTLFPEMFQGPFSCSILQRAQEHHLLTIRLIQLRDFALGRHQQVDDTSYGGGPGMVMKVDVLDRALQFAVAEEGGHVVCLTPQGQKFNQDHARRLAQLGHLILVCGHYEGMDERFVQTRVDEEFSLGDFVLTGGEIPAMALVDAITRMVPGVLGDDASCQADSFYHGILDHPHYTRPAVWDAGMEWGEVGVPKVLLSGDHGAIQGWRRRRSLLSTWIRRPDLLVRAELTKSEKRFFEQLHRDLEALLQEKTKDQAHK